LPTAWLRNEEGADVDVHHVIPVLLRELDDGRPADDTGVVEQDVDATELLDRRVDDPGHTALVREIGSDGHAAAP
jgi:hypothetical protein